MRTVRAALVATVVLAVAGTAGCGGDQKGAGPAPSTTTSSVTTKTPGPIPSLTPSPTPTTAYLTGIGKLSASQILARTKAAMKAADSVRITGHTTSDGSLMTLNLALTRTTGRATIITGAEQMTIIAVGKNVYIQGNDAFWKSAADNKQEGDALAVLFRGKWLMTTTTAKQFGDLSNLAVKDDFADAIVMSGKYRKTGPSLVDGYNCIGLRDSDAVLWIDQITGRPIAMRSFAQTEVLSFTDYNRVPQAQAPPASLIVDASALH